MKEKLTTLLRSAIKRLESGESTVKICLSCYFPNHKKYDGWVSMSYEILGDNYIVNNDYDVAENPNRSYLFIKKNPPQPE